jgi:RND family efflux transporter MFP subunit
VLLALALALACSPNEAGDEVGARVSLDAGASPAPLRLVGAIVLREAVVEPIFGTGTIVADKTTELGAVVAGIVEAIHVKEGDRVAAGQPLFTTRQVDYQIGRQEAEHAARLAAAEAAKAERDWQRARQLHSQGVASQGNLDDALTALEIANARRDVAGSALARARQNLTDTQVLAPYAGVISRRYVDEGVRMGGMAAPGAVVQLMKVDVVEAVIQVPEMHGGQVREGMAARVRIDGIAGGVFESVVGRVHPMADPESRAFEVRVPIENPELAVRPGLFAKAELFPEARAALVLERAAVLGAGERRYVFVEEEGAARRRPVRVRELDALRLEVIDGLGEGDRVLAGPNLPAVTEGAAVSLDLARAAH